MRPDTFVLEADKKGMDAVKLKDLLTNVVQKKAAEVMGLLRSLPPTWNLSPDRV